VARIITTKITAKIFKSPDYPNGKIEGLTLTKCHNQELHHLAMLEEVLIGNLETIFIILGIL
jgi:hypothetical protein